MSGAGKKGEHVGGQELSFGLGHAVELCFTPTYASWAHPMEAHFGALRDFTINNSDYLDHAALAKTIRACDRWLDANATDPEMLALEHKHRVEIRGETQYRWGQPERRAA